jgi:molybdenum-dependent DNA-binding transcriptional regulator ModE
MLALKTQACLNMDNAKEVGMTQTQAIEHFGSVSALAKALNVTYEAVRQWNGVPELRQYQIERITLGALKAELNLQAA